MASPPNCRASPRTRWPTASAARRCYPLLLAPIVQPTATCARASCPRTCPPLVQLAQALRRAPLSIWLIALVARRAAGERAAAVAAWLAAVYPPLVWICGYALSEAVYVVLAMLVAWRSGESTARHRAFAGVSHGGAGRVACWWASRC